MKLDDERAVIHELEEVDWEFWQRALRLNWTHLDWPDCEACRVILLDTNWWDPDDGEVHHCAQCGDEFNSVKLKEALVRESVERELLVMRTPWGDVSALVSQVRASDPPIAGWTVVAFRGKWEIHEDDGVLRLNHQGFGGDARVQDFRVDHPELLDPPGDLDMNEARRKASRLAWLLWPAIRTMNLLITQMGIHNTESTRLNPRGLFEDDARWLDHAWEADGSLRVTGVKEKEFLEIMEES